MIAEIQRFMIFIKILKKKVNKIDVYDPLVNSEDVFKEYKINVIEQPKKNYYDGLILAVNHKIFKKKENNIF